MLLTDSDESQCYEEALQAEAKDKWEFIMDDEIVSHEEPNIRFGWTARKQLSPA